MTRYRVWDVDDDESDGTEYTSLCGGYEGAGVEDVAEKFCKKAMEGEGVNDGDGYDLFVRDLSTGKKWTVGVEASVEVNWYAEIQEEAEDDEPEPQDDTPKGEVVS